MVQLNPNVVATSEPPIPEAMAWLDLPRRDPGQPLLNLAQAVPSYPPDSRLREAMAKAALAEETAFYTPILGVDSLREKYAASLGEAYGGPVSAGDVAITAGGNHAFCMAVLALAGPGDEVMIAQPHYFNHDMWCTMQGIKPVSLPCTVTAEGVVPEVAEAERRLTDRTRAIILVTPNNPTGTVYSEGLVEDFYALAQKHNIALVIDETYRDFLPPHPPHKLFQNETWRDGFVHLYSFSKAYSLTGYRVGALAAGPRIMGAVSKIADTVTICPSHIGQLAALYGIEHMGAWKDARRDEMSVRLDALDAAFKEQPGGYRLVSRGAFFAYIEHPFPDRDAVDVARELVQQKALFMLPGPTFGAGQERYLRAAFANVDPAGISELGRRLEGR